MNALKLLALWILLATVSFPVNAQNREVLYKNRVKWTTSRLIDLYNPGMDFSYERVYAHRFSTQLSAAKLIDVFGITDFRNYTGARYAIEERYYFPIRPFFMFSLGTEFVHLQSEFDFTGTFFSSAYSSQAPKYEYREDFSLKKRMRTLNFRFGIHFLIDQVLLEISGGPGFRYREVQYHHLENPYDFMKNPQGMDLLYNAVEEGNFKTLTIALDFRVGYVFSR